MVQAPQDVFRVRRSYNQWVADETLEDYALRFTAKSARKWSVAGVSQTALGSISFLALEAIGGAITLNYGFSNAVAAIMVVGAIIFLMGVPISYHAAKHGIDIDLLTRGAGFGYIGSTVTSLIYASFTFIFFALEAAILALALELTLGLHVSIGYVISALVVIPLVTHGITLISRFQVWSQPFWVILQILPLVFIALHSEDALTLWTSFETGSALPASSDQGNFSVLAFGAAASVLFSLIAQIGEQVDFLRFLPHQEKPSKRWWFAMVMSGPGWIIVGTIKLLIGSFLAVLALNQGFSPEQATDPNHMYLNAFNYVTQSETLSLLLLGIFIVISQLKINVTNAYAGSIAWSNFFSRLTHSHPGRVVWVVFNVLIALVLMELGIYRILEDILGSYAIVALSWVGALVADLTVNRPLGLRPQEMEFKRAHLYDINPVGVGSMAIATVVGFACHAGVFGENLQALSSFVTLFISFVCAPLIAWGTKGRYYIARPIVFFTTKENINCVICENAFEPEDMTHCPAYEGNICSLCCSLDARCDDMCKTDSKFSQQLVAALSIIFPQSVLRAVQTRIGHFFGLFTIISLAIYSVLFLVYFQATTEVAIEHQAYISEALASAFINVFFILLIICGVVAWMFSLAHDSRVVSQRESKDQTKLLRAEIEAHQQTDRALQEAKEQADSANLAKSRYLTGISHELRSPLNAIMGYAQLLEKDNDIPMRRRGALTTIRRSSEHLSDLIEGLLDISRIEAGRLELDKSNVRLNELLDQLVDMFSMQAQSKHIGFRYEKLSAIPDLVRTDEKRLRQILINLLSNAVKYTHEGSISFQVSFRSEVAEFKIKDSGVGIDQAAIETIFKPFERIHEPGQPNVAGTGLGLTITRLLLDIMGGDIQVKSLPGEGSEFKVALMLSKVANEPEEIVEAEKSIIGYQGRTRYVFVVDDEPTHRGLINELLSPLKFNVVMAQDGAECLDMLEHCQFVPDIFLLDVSMPGMNGWELAEKLRDKFPQAAIIMTSANAHIRPTTNENPSDAYIVKPIQHQDLFQTLQDKTDLEWIYQNDGVPVPKAKPESELSEHETMSVLSLDLKQELIRLAQIGYISAIRSKLEIAQSSANDSSAAQNELTELYDLANSFQFAKLIEKLEGSL